MKYLDLAIIGILGFGLAIAVNRLNSTQEKWKTAEANLKAYSNLLESSKNQSAALKLTVDQLEYFQDSILKALDATRRELKVKDKNLQSVQYISSVFTRTDTLHLRDTIFKSPSLQMDTLIGDEWYKVKLGLTYPATIFVHPEFKSEKHIVVSTKKETVNPPKKLWLFRLFQKKHKVLKVDVIEKNPYVDSQESRYVEII